MILCAPLLLVLITSQVANSKPNNYNNYIDDYYYGYDALYYDDNSVYVNVISDDSNRDRSDHILELSSTYNNSPEIAQCLREENVTFEIISKEIVKIITEGDAGPALGRPHFGYLTPIPNTPLAPGPEISPIFTQTKYFQGDIIFRSKEEYCRVILPPPKDEPCPAGGTTRFDGTKWPNAKIPIKIEPGFSEKERSVIVNAMNEIRGKTCIEFPDFENQRECVFIQKSEKNECAAQLGYIKGQNCLLKLGDGCFGSGNSTHEFGTVLHELLHVAGFYHTHSRCDRDEHVNIHEEHIETSATHNFYKSTLSVMKNVLGLPYDVKSIMHYPWYAFQNQDAKKFRKATVTKISNEAEKIIEKHTLSELDVIGINTFYNCFVEQPPNEPPTITCNILSCPLNGRCREGNGIVAATCVCDHGYRMEGNYCIRIETCASLSCPGNGRCREGYGGAAATCVCDDGYRMEGSYCIRIETCASLSCPGNGKCREGYGGAAATCVCDDGYRMEGNYCIRIETCASLSCPGNGRCREGHGGAAATCVCDDGYRMEGNVCIVTCHALSCPHNGRCEEGSGRRDATCVCNNGYRLDGNTCRVTCHALSCPHNGRCEEGSGRRDATCVCNNGYRFDGDTCRVTCSALSCTHNGRCEEGNGRRDANCVCNNGYRFEGHTCRVTCSALSCPHNGRCEEGSGRRDATCVCNNGYRLDGNTCRVTCSALSCPHNGRCEEGSGGRDATCVCNNGYRLDGNTCRVTCHALSCSHNGRCGEGSGSKDATCVCNNGYRWDGNTCRVTCNILSCKQDEFCYEGYGSKPATCVCNPDIGGSLGGYLPPRKC